jgi:hypothetical protein
MVSQGTMASGAGTRRDEERLRVTRTTRARREAVALFVIAIGLVVGSVILRASAVRREEAMTLPPEPTAAAPRPPDRVAAADGAERPAPSAGDGLPATMPRTRAGKLRALRRAGVTPSRGPDGKPRIDAAPVIDALHAAGVHDGIGAFGKPGTDPPKEGVIVPEGLELPEGYVRHYQTTDDGEALPPILMFHPDYDFTDEAGNPIAVPLDRVVPRELVPPGIPVEMLHVPARRG